MQRILIFLFCIVLCGTLSAQTEDASARLLESLLGESKSPPPPSSAPQEGMAVRIYQLAQIRVDAPNGLRAVNVLKRWLPAGSTVSAVPANNALHILTTATAHEAASEFLATLDQVPAINGGAIDPRLKEAIEKFSEVSSQPQEMRRILEDFTGRMNDNFTAAQNSSVEKQNAEQRRWFYLTSGIGGATLLLVLIMVIVASRRRPSPTTELALAPQHVAQFVQPLRAEVNHQLEVMSQDVKQVVETALQIQRQSEVQRSSELVGLKTQLEAYLNKRDSLLENSRVEMEKTATRLNASADAIQASQIKVEALTDQLREAMREIDRLQCVVSEREENLQLQSELLRTKEDEMTETRNRLSKNLAKLTLLANELGAEDSFFTTPLPAFDRFIDGDGSAPSNEQVAEPSLDAATYASEDVPAFEPISPAPASPEAPSALTSSEPHGTDDVASAEPKESWRDVEFHDPSKV